jgi:hypothetical protein
MGLKNIIKKIVMGFSAKNIEINNKPEEPSKAPLRSLNLSKTEVETLLLMVKEAHFKGEHVQKVYELVIKLQNYYSQLP